MKIIITTCLILAAIIGFIARPNYGNNTVKITLSVQKRNVDARLEKAEVHSLTSTAKPKTKMAMVLPSQEEVAKQVRGAFTEEPEVAVAVFRAESGLRANAQGWNCHYYDSAGVRYSAACKLQDRENAWSVDCGVAQINTPGNSCPEHLFDVETNLAAAYKKYVARGWQPWVAHNLGRHLAFLQ